MLGVLFFIVHMKGSLVIALRRAKNSKGVSVGQVNEN